MFLLKRNVSLTDHELKEIKQSVKKTIEKMLVTKDETLNILKPYDMVLICSWEGNYLVMDIFQHSKFTVFDRKDLKRKNTPFYIAARSLHNIEEPIVYLDEHKDKGLGIKNLQAFYYVCELLMTLDIDVFSSQEYKCVW